MKATHCCCIIVLVLIGCNNQQKQSVRKKEMNGPGRMEEEINGPVHTMRHCWLQTNRQGNPDTSLNHHYVFDKLSYKTEFYSYAGPGIVRSKGKYDSSRRIFTDSTYNSKGEVISFVGHTYNNQGQIVSKESYNGSLIPSYIEKYLYDNSGNRVQTDIYKDGKEVTESTIDKYNSASQLVESRMFDAGVERTEYTTYKYDENGNRTEKDDFTDGKLHHVNKYRYDDKGSIIEEVSEYLDRDFSSTRHYSYEYDSFGNWTKQMGARPDNPDFVVVRVFTYY